MCFAVKHCKICRRQTRQNQDDQSADVYHRRAHVHHRHASQALSECEKTFICMTTKHFITTKHCKICHRMDRVYMHHCQALQRSVTTKHHKIRCKMSDMHGITAKHYQLGCEISSVYDDKFARTSLHCKIYHKMSSMYVLHHQALQKMNHIESASSPSTASTVKMESSASPPSTSRAVAI